MKPGDLVTLNLGSEHADKRGTFYVVVEESGKLLYGDEEVRFLTVMDSNGRTYRLTESSLIQVGE